MKEHDLDMNAKQSTLPIKHRIADLLPEFSIHLVLIIFSLICLIPFLLIISASLTDEGALVKEGFRLIPSSSTFSTESYRYLFQTPDQILQAYKVTVFITVVGTATSVLIMSLLAYPLSRVEFKLRGIMSFVVFFTLLFSGGLVPYYILVTRYLHLRDSIWILILPQLVNPFYVLILRTFFAALPKEIFDAARVDGAGEFQIFFRVAMPMAQPALATIGLLVALGYWNEWVNVLYFIDDPDKVTLQYLLYQIQQQIQFLNENPGLAAEGIRVPTQSIRMAIAVIITGPAAFAFLFFQRYLTRGITLGSFK
jgi:putative aldouronate transport system permease protein